MSSVNGRNLGDLRPASFSNHTTPPGSTATPSIHTIRRRQLLAGAGSLLASPTVVRAQTQSNGVALVIGNSKYLWEAPLPNVRRDAPDVAKRLQDLGLKTELVQDAGRDAMLAALEKFKAASSGANMAVLYFAGHGASWDKDTYAFAREKKLVLPEGLVAIRSDGASPHSGKIGAFEAQIRIPFGSSSSSAFSVEPIIVAVLSFDEGGVAQTILSYRSYPTHQPAGPIWGFVPGRLLRDELRLPAKFPSVPLWLRWKDDKGGLSASNLTQNAYSARFTRLDG